MRGKSLRAFIQITGSCTSITDNDFTGDEPQPLFAVTEMFPPFDPAVAEIEFVAEEPDQPDGNVHV